MRKILIIALLPVFLAGCYNSKSAGNVKEKSFAQQYAELEKQPLSSLADDSGASALQSAADRQAAVDIAAQKERRARPPLVESNYIFQVMPEKSTVYSYDEYNEVWTGEPRAKDYKETKRLWTKPKRTRGDYNPDTAAAAPSSAPAAPTTPSAPPADDEGWDY